MLVTRPFLLCMLLRGSELANTPKKQYFDGFSRLCVSAAEASIDIFEDMVPQGLVSSLVLIDFFFALHVVQVILAASALYCPETHQAQAKRCVAILKAIGSFGCPKHLLPETLFELQQVGLLDDLDSRVYTDELPNGLLNTSFEGSSLKDTRYEPLHDPDLWLKSR